VVSTYYRSGLRVLVSGIVIEDGSDRMAYQERMTMHRTIEIVPVIGMPEVVVGADLPELIFEASCRSVPVESGDIVAVAQKVVSKAEGAIVRLDSVEPSDEAIRIAAVCGKDQRLVQVILNQTVRIVRIGRGVLIVETLHGFVCANAGIDASNVPGENTVAILPVDPVLSAECLLKGFETRVKGPVGVLITDSFNRPWRDGATNIAIATAGLIPLSDLRGTKDDYGRELLATLISVADELAGAAQLVMGEVQGVPAAIIKGTGMASGARGKLTPSRSRERDLFQ